MSSVVQFIRTIIFVAFVIGACGSLIEVTGCVGKEAAMAYRRGGVSLVWLNRVLVGIPKK